MAPARCAGAFFEPCAAGLPRTVSMFCKIAPLPPNRRRQRGVRARALRTARRSAPAGAGKASMAPRPRGAGLVGLRPGLLQQVVPKRAVLDADDSPPGRHEGRFTDTPLDSLWSFPTARPAGRRKRRQGAFSPVVGALALPASGCTPVQPFCGDAESAMSPFGLGGRCVLGGL